MNCYEFKSFAKRSKSNADFWITGIFSKITDSQAFFTLSFRLLPKFGLFPILALEIIEKLKSIAG